MRGLRTLIAALAVLVAVVPAAAQYGVNNLTASGYSAVPAPSKQAPSVPEPGMLALLVGGCGGAALAAVRRLRR